VEKRSSLRNKLLRWLIPTYIVVAVVTTVFAWVSAKEMVDGFMNEQMEDFARLHVGAQRAIPPKHTPDRDGAYEVVLWRPDGTLRDATFSGFPVDAREPAGFSEVESNGLRWYVYTLPTVEGKVQTLQRFDFRLEAIAELSNRTLLSLLLLIPLSSLIVWIAIRVSLRPLNTIAQSAAEQNERTLSALPLMGVPDEIRPLVLSINSLLDRLRESFAAQQRFVHDAAHELRTPVTALHVQLQNLRDAIPSTASPRINTMEAGLRRAQRVVEQLLRLAREDAGPTGSRIREWSLQEQLKASITALLPLADQRGIDLGFQADADCLVEGPEEEIRSLLDNLLDNAVRYSPPGAVVDTQLVIVDDTACIEIVDEGPGIPEDQLPRVFDRFFRVAGTGVEGSGLGLAIARGAAERLHARIELTNRPACGLCARVTFHKTRRAL
jgi:two-component system, OmpR family, sensor kinase